MNLTEARLKLTGNGVEAIRASGTPGVRPLEEGDLPRIIEIYERVFSERPGAASGVARPHLRDIFWRHPWRDDRLPSLVYEETPGRVVGCLGVMPRPMSIEGRPVRAAISHTFMVDPDHRAGLAGLALARTFLAGPQDLSIAEGGEASRRLLERLGGTTVLGYSLRWTRPLRPCRYLLSHLARRGVPSGLTRLLRPFAAAADALMARLPRAPFRTLRSRLTEKPLDPAALQSGIEELSRERALRPIYRPETLAWLLELLEPKRERGTLEAIALRDAEDRVAGWYVAYLNAGGISEVVQIGARRGAMQEVLEQLFRRLWSKGAIAVSGQLDPQRFESFARSGCLFHHDGRSWFLVHSRRRDLIEAIHRGDALLGRLEGEWSIGF